MEFWQKNLLVCWFSAFFIASGNNQVAPILPLFIEQLGVQGTEEIAQWSGIALGINLLSLAIFSPIWGKAADRYGRKPMLLRSSFGLAIIVIFMAYVQNVYQLVGLRMLQGALSGYISAAIALVATQTPKERVGWALGTLSTGQIAGTLMGPLIGGFLSETLGIRSVFLSIGVFALGAFIASLIYVKEQFTVMDKRIPNLREIWILIPNPRLMIAMFITTFIVQLALLSIQPIITLYIARLSQDTAHLALISGAVVAASGLGSVVAAPWLGQLSDKIGPHKVILAALLVSGILFLPQAFVENPLQLGILRFLLGLATAGLLPAINTLVKRSTPDEIAGRAFGYNQAAQHLGGFGGAVLGGQVTAFLGIEYVRSTITCKCVVGL
ncbi:MAG: major facilitator superfamily 1 [Sporomusa sp.]|nr:major facilitator superfamily 1 [Sporomusa sp.]